MNITRDIQTLSEFKQNASKLVKRVQETGQPMILTVNGKPAVVVQDAETFQQTNDAREYYETVAVLRERSADLKNGHKWPTHQEVFDQIREKYKIPRD